MVISSTTLMAGRLDSTAQSVCFAIVRKFSVCAFLVGVLVVIGWAFDITVLKSGLPGLGATQPWTAVCIMLCALSLGLSTRPNDFARALARICATALLLVVVLVLLQNVLDADWGTDRLLFPRAVVTEQTGPFLRAGRPAGAALIAFGLAGISLLLVSSANTWATRTFVLLTTVGMLGIISVLLAYAFSLRTLYTLGLYAQAGLNTSIGMALLFAGLLARRADLGWMKSLCGDGRGAVSTRWLLSWTVAVLIVLAGIVQLGIHASWYRAELAVALATLAGIGVLFAGLLSHARRIDALENTLADSLQRKQAFLMTFAHSLRNPLSPLRNGLEILRRRTAPDELLRPTVEMMERQMKELAGAIDALIEEYSREPPRK